MVSCAKKENVGKVRRKYLEINRVNHSHFSVSFLTLLSEVILIFSFFFSFFFELVLLLFWLLFIIFFLFFLSSFFRICFIFFVLNFQPFFFLFFFCFFSLLDRIISNYSLSLSFFFFFLIHFIHLLYIYICCILLNIHRWFNTTRYRPFFVLKRYNFDFLLP